MEKIKEFFSSPKKTAFLGLIGSILMLSSLIIDFSISYILNDLYAIGLIVYFLIVLARMYKQKGNIKIANYIVILGYSIELLLMIIFSTTYGFNLQNILYIIVFIIPILYFFNILLGKKNFVNNKVFAVLIILYTLIQTIFVIQTFQYYSSIVNMIYLINFLSYICIIPYFYNYYEVLKEENKNG